ncbi:solute carrier family 2, facilitated glucose transporter member 11 isoform X3 [Bos javanicus]|uniref:solute carrier family 2, facilitated glucose transporter member 11 isoform X3 n=1 Tax=Bos javanicus TaxID=9906 RepID=UPI002AA8F7B0|nr:solute carrier family 2, facilitated glucose transporter member 11 isoform X3 [Bos javanicus]
MLGLQPETRSPIRVPTPRLCGRRTDESAPETGGSAFHPSESCPSSGGRAETPGLEERGDVRAESRARPQSARGRGPPGDRGLPEPDRGRGRQMEAQGRVLLLTICAAGIGGTFQFGYNLSIINAPTLYVQEFTNETWRTRTGQPLPDHLVLLAWSLIVSLYPLGGLLGALLAGPLAVTLGRKKSLLVNNVFVLAAAALFGFSRRAGSFEMIMLGRLLVGISAALQRLRGPADLAGELAELEQERAVCGGGRARRPWELFRERALRRQVASLVVLGGAMELCGNDAIYAYASAVFSQAGIPQDKIQYAAIGTGGCELLATLLSCLVIERAGRRVLLTGGYGLMTCWGSVFTVALCLQGSFSWMAYLAMACIFAFILSFGIGPAGVTGILATELFDQMARPAAYMVCGALMWTMLFLVGLVFPFIMVGLPAPAPPGAGGGLPLFCPCQCENPPPWGGSIHPGSVTLNGDGAHLSQEGGGPHGACAGASGAAGAPWATAGLGSLATPRRACRTSSTCRSSVSASARLCTRASSSPRPEARASWRYQRSCTDSTSPGGAEARRGLAPRSSGPRSCSSASTAGRPRALPLLWSPRCAGQVLSLKETVSGASRRPMSGGCQQETSNDKLRETQAKKIQLVKPLRGAWPRKDFLRS